MDRPRRKKQYDSKPNRVEMVWVDDIDEMKERATKVLVNEIDRMAAKLLDGQGINVEVRVDIIKPLEIKDSKDN